MIGCFNVKLIKILFITLNLIIFFCYNLIYEY